MALSIYQPSTQCHVLEINMSEETISDSMSNEPVTLACNVKMLKCDNKI